MKIFNYTWGELSISFMNETRVAWILFLIHEILYKIEGFNSPLMLRFCCDCVIKLITYNHVRLKALIIEIIVGI